MKKIISLLMVVIIIISVVACSPFFTEKRTNSLSEIQSIVRETQSAFESKDSQGTQQGISKLIELSKDSMYSELERTVAQFCATYINTGVMLDYIIKNDIKWLETHDVTRFDVLYSGIFVEVINGGVTHVETLKGYLRGLVEASQEIFTHYNELIKK